MNNRNLTLVICTLLLVICDGLFGVALDWTLKYYWPQPTAATEALIINALWCGGGSCLIIVGFLSWQLDSNFIDTLLANQPPAPSVKVNRRPVTTTSEGPWFGRTAAGAKRTVVVEES